MHRNAGRRLVLTVVIAALGALGACSSDESSNDGTAGSNVATTTQAEVVSTDAPIESSPSTEAGSTEAESTEVAAAPRSLTGAEVCEAAPGELVGDALGVEITEVEPSDSGTPQCAYFFTTAEASTDNVTVAAERSVEDLGGLTGSDAYDYVLEINRTIAGGAAATETVVDAGDQAVVLTGSSLSFGILDVGGRVIAIIVPDGAADEASITALVVALADAFADV